MLNRVLSSLIRRFERRYDYDMGYAHALLAASPAGFFRFLPVTWLATAPDHVPAGAWYAAKIAATRQGDCGPCTQLVLTMAADAGLAPTLLRAIVRREMALLDGDTALGLHFADAVLTRTSALEALRHEVSARWGERGLASLALAITVGGMFPTLKYALGYGHTCRMLYVAGEALTPARAQISANPRE